MFKNKSMWVLSILASAIALTACQPKAEHKNPEHDTEQTSASEVQQQSLSLVGETERVAVTLPDCSGNSCPEFSVDRLHTNQFVIDGIIDQAVLYQLNQILDITDVNEAALKTAEKAKDQTNETDVASQATDIKTTEIKTPVQLLAEQVQPFVATFLALDQDLKNLGASHQISLSISPKILNASGPLSTVVLNTSSYLGGAHGSSSQVYYNFDLKKQKQVSLDELIQPKQKAKLDAFAYEAFKKWVVDSKLTDNVAEYEQAWKFKLSNNFYLGKQGLILQYEEYEIGPYVVGLPRLTLPYEQLKTILKSEYLPVDLQVDQPNQNTSTVNQAKS